MAIFDIFIALAYQQSIIVPTIPDRNFTIISQTFYNITTRHFTISPRHSSTQTDVAHYRRENINYNSSADLDTVDRFYTRDERKQDCV